MQSETCKKKIPNVNPLQQLSGPNNQGDYRTKLQTEWHERKNWGSPLVCFATVKPRL